MIPSKRLTALALGAVLIWIPAWAQDERDDDHGETKQETFKTPQWHGWGVRLGVADDPDQVLAGVQFDFGDIARRVYLEPNVEIGVGDDHTILAVTGALHYRFRLGHPFRPYAGGGITLGLDRYDPPESGSDTDLEIALKLIGGTTWVFDSGREFFLEGALISGSLQDVEILVGWRF